MFRLHPWQVLRRRIVPCQRGLPTQLLQARWDSLICLNNFFYTHTYNHIPFLARRPLRHGRIYAQICIHRVHNCFRRRFVTWFPLSTASCILPSSDCPFPFFCDNCWMIQRGLPLLYVYCLPFTLPTSSVYPWMSIKWPKHK